MRKKFKIPTICLLLLLLSSYNSVKSQNGTVPCMNTMVNDSSIFEENISGEFFIRTELYKGSVFYNPDWRYGSILFENNKKVYHKYLNYYMITGELFWLRSSDYKQVIVDKETVKEFTVYPKENNKQEIFRKLTFRPWYRLDSITEFLQVLSEGEINLFAYRSTNINKTTDEVFPRIEYYFQLKNGEIKFLRKGRWSLYDVAGVNNKIMKKIVRSNHFRVRQESDLIKAVDLFNRSVKTANP